MAKAKPHKGLLKRVKVSASGKVMRHKSCAGHLMSGKSGRRCQRLRRKTSLGGQLAANVLRAIRGG
ncbi:MAG: 50S ribosomal protein L35 [Planctomycetes bacterium]|nr:50S ribosomal protein L35 [Planctomycetota bacterium]